MEIRPQIIDLGRPRLLLGIPWLTSFNPEINWAEQTLSWRHENSIQQLKELINSVGYEEQDSNKDQRVNNKEEEIHFLDALDLGDNILNIDNTFFEEINFKTNASQAIAQQFGKKKESDPCKVVLKKFNEYLDVFSKEKASRFPPLRSFDHKIDLQDSFQPRSFKAYNLSPKEEEDVKGLSAVA
ncbi:hypothetical protein NP233_g310 [Leucocoprinus birnbaumii]|uniref:Uncharacterized protein n=1 Tax=Leucocoprinus birnbaumii TaxID=56174 RepID=A0AAD5Z0C4_9AGAR|nr:hypothetical protein NP233_g310 [Leucocoprinus birnbaumii]